MFLSRLGFLGRCRDLPTRTHRLASSQCCIKSARAGFIKPKEPSTVSILEIVNGSWLIGSWLLNIYFNVVLTRFTTKWHMLNFCVCANWEQRLATVRAFVPSCWYNRVPLKFVNVLFVMLHTTLSSSPSVLAIPPPC